MQVFQQHEELIFNITYEENGKRHHDLECQQIQTHQGVLQELEKVHHLFHIQEEKNTSPK